MFLLKIKNETISDLEANLFEIETKLLSGALKQKATIQRLINQVKAIRYELNLRDKLYAKEGF